MSRTLKFGLIVLLIAVIAAFLSNFFSGYPGARATPSRTEAAVARLLRSWTLPATARKNTNPFQSSPQLLQESARHFADHCASCHANDGSGATEMGRNLFPRVPDMRAEATQRLTDGELYYIIHNGVRWTGMPAWGNSDNDPDSWKLVLFIRHLPHLTQDELHDMERFNPKSISDQEEEKQEEQFLNGGPMPSAPAEHHHHSEPSK